MNRYKILSLVIISTLLFSFRTNKPVVTEGDKFVVVLDAGHGGKDPGNMGNGYLEKNIALNIVLEVGRILEKNPAIKVIYTRKSDKFVDLFVRGKIANEANADLFVSVHCDSHTSEAHGAGTFVLGLHKNKQNFAVAKSENEAIYFEEDYETKYASYDINSPESIIGLTIMQEEFLSQSIDLAKRIQDNFTGKLKRKDRKVKQAGFIVLHQTFMPSVLVESGFLTYGPEGKYLNSKAGQIEMGKAIADAIIDFNGVYVAETQELSNVKKTPVEKDKPQELVKKEVTPKKKEVVKEVIEKVKPVVAEKANETKKITSSAKKEASTDKLKKATLIFKVQLAASSKNIPLIGENFESLDKLSKEKYTNLYRYFYGATPSYDQAKAYQKVAIHKGYTTCFIVAYKEGKRIALSTALKSMKQ